MTESINDGIVKEALRIFDPGITGQAFYECVEHTKILSHHGREEVAQTKTSGTILYTLRKS